jgi:hypothetical protein
MESFLHTEDHNQSSHSTIYLWICSVQKRKATEHITARNFNSSYYFMEQSSSWEANRFVASQENPGILLNPKVHYCIHNCSPPVSFLKMHANIILPPTPGSPQWSLSLRFPHQNPIHASLLPHAHYMPRPFHSRFYHPHNIGWGVQLMKLLIMKFSNTLSLRSSLNVSDKLSHPYKTIALVCFNTLRTNIFSSVFIINY